MTPEDHTAPDYDVIIVGSGPAGVSAAFPLVKKGLRVLMIDGGEKPGKNYPVGNYLDIRKTDAQQWRWILGENFHALKMQDAVSPKLRIPGLAYVFNRFHSANNIQGNNFISVGSLATGGLSNAWGAGVARFSNEELHHFPVPIAEWNHHYSNVSKRIGISGKNDDDLKEYFGVDEDAQTAITLDDNNSDLFKQYNVKRNNLKQYGFTLGRSRVAVLTKDSGERKACSLSGNCLWGCANRSIYSAAEDVTTLQSYKNFQLISGMIAKDIIKQDLHWLVMADRESPDGITNKQFTTTKVILAAGTLASTRLALKTLQRYESVKLLSSPTAAFLVWNYKRFGAARKPGFGLGQLSYTINIDEKTTAFGSTFSTAGIPIAEFAKQVPLSRPIAIDVLSALLSSCVVGNIFLPGHLTNANARLSTNNTLEVSGAYTDSVPHAMKTLSKKIRGAFLKMGGFVLPGSFTVGLPGSDIHYAGSLPMSEMPEPGKTSANGELFGASGLFVVDGAVLPILPEKSHTLTIMANAERIGKFIADSI